MSFKEIIQGLTDDMRISGINEEFISLVRPYIRWEELGKQANYLPQEFADIFIAALIDSRDGWYCYKYCGYVKDRPEVWQALVNSGDGASCFRYCRYVKDRPEVWQALVNSGDVKFCFRYCRYVKDRPEVRQVLIDSGNIEACYWYCQNVKDRPEVRKVFDKE